ncbi:acetyl-CoA carboxylase biotin carboxylase subunit [Rubrivirga sp. S365]|uniref:Acetyl-CoA carboxylase biotin carboxylase subunit n=1 Tax=Rubrivirga litoralis TaxID=3075598 RepID=A0ABU3BQY1_9BACT|nr:MULTISPECIES: acetyl-CoA carboxylase biotin carboxylase subunit [unclassified Rubrivirga]MDT0631690.1 acetyl-CoA carboxylase biotin carboxylase subunit [Rubrivirga sp. F394]MDT7855566.1 acetyl-CoA carboxylase biotin carboxylase subunit [Rubrivirga sp. S365]
MTPRRLQKVLVANRGEIAVRVMRTCRERGIATVAVYSEADRDALHVRLADEAVEIGPPPSSESYLVGGAVLDAARQTGADAVHPGYGFLSENAAFAQACGEAGLVWIGPPPEAIRLMGDKTEARKLMQAAGVPMAPGTPDAIAEAAEAERVAGEIGYPVLVKAAAGGGGKGMRVVERPEDFRAGFERATSEAESAFGDGRVYVEKYLVGPRHVEIQVLADAHGNVVHLFERECSIQRRHQKVIEEAPSAVLTPDLRAAMGEAAVQAARACDYVGAGTVEFLLDGGAFYFLEMNTRLQVEHPVTEMITGLDLVAEQIRIAEGEPLGYGQDDVRIWGHAVECRVYAEDVPAGFLPAPGPLLRHRPAAGPGVRVDAGVEEGDEVPVYYDPMVSKLVAWGRTRDEAIARMDRALGEYDVAGVRTTIPFCRYVMGHPAFRSGDFDTGFVAEHFDASALAPSPDAERTALLAAGLEALGRGGAPTNAAGDGARSPTAPAVSRWARRRR